MNLHVSKGKEKEKMIWSKHNNYNPILTWGLIEIMWGSKVTKFPMYLCRMTCVCAWMLLRFDLKSIMLIQHFCKNYVICVKVTGK
jgi:hypothetical protein